MGPVGDVLISTFGDTIIVELGLHTGFEIGVKVYFSFNIIYRIFITLFRFERLQMTSSLLIP